ncbi:MAG: thermonuclease family protein [Anaerohalosphaeraceae bacterium]
MVLDRWTGGSIRQVVKASLYESDDWKKYHEQQFLVAAVIDGDTIDLKIPDNEYPTTRVRLLGIDTPETKNPQTGVMYFGPEASEFTRRLCENKTVVVLLDSAADQRDKYGRLLAYIRLPDGTILNERILAEGCGYAFLPYEHSDFDAYLELQNQAIQSGAGLWKNATRKDLPQWLSKRRPDLLRQPKNQIKQ